MLERREGGEQWGGKEKKYPVVAGLRDGRELATKGGDYSIGCVDRSKEATEDVEGPPRMWCPAQLRSQQLLTNGGINKQSATRWKAVGGRGDKGTGGVER